MLLGPQEEFGRIGNELPSDRIVGISAVDQIGQGAAQADGIARADLAERLALRLRREAGGDKFFDRGDGRPHALRSLLDDRRPQDLIDPFRARSPA